MPSPMKMAVNERDILKTDVEILLQPDVFLLS
jgi:hypothetical protein